MKPIRILRRVRVRYGVFAIITIAVTASSLHAQSIDFEGSEQALAAWAAYVREIAGPLMASEPAQMIASPGQALFELLGASQLRGGWALAAFLIGWYFWLWLIRGLFFAVGGLAGFASITHYKSFRALWLPWEWVAQKYFWLRGWVRQRRYGEGPSGRWASFWEMAAYPFDAEKGTVPVGKLPLWQRLSLHRAVGLPDGEKSVCYVSYAGGGKSAQLATWLGCLPAMAAALVYDMDAAFVNAFGAVLQAAGHKVVKLDVDSMAKGFTAFGHWSPFAELTAVKNRLGAGAVIAFAGRLADTLLVEDSKSQPVFVQQARVFLKALILYIWLVEPEKTLKRLRVLLNRGAVDLIEDEDESGFGRLLFEMSSVTDRYKDGTLDDGCNGAMCEAISNAAGLMKNTSAGADKDSPDSFRKTAIYQTQWIDDDQVHAMTAYSDMDCSELKLSNTVVFLVGSLSDMQGQRLGPLMRAFTGMALYTFEKVEPEKKLRYPCLFLLDECPNVGRIDSLITALAGFRKFGVRLVVATQSIGLLRGTYPDKYKEFLNQSQCVVWMGISPTDTETLDELVKVLGSCLRREKQSGWHWFPRLFFRTFRVRLPQAIYRDVPRLLLERSQCAAFLNRAHGQIIVTREGGDPPMRLKKLSYWKDLAVWQYAVHRGHGETVLRSGTRLSVSQFSKGANV